MFFLYDLQVRFETGSFMTYISGSNDFAKVLFLMALVAQSDARPTGDQEVSGSIPTVSGNIFSWRLIMKYFLQSFSPFH